MCLMTTMGICAVCSRQQLLTSYSFVAVTRSIFVAEIYNQEIKRVFAHFARVCEEMLMWRTGLTYVKSPEVVRPYLSNAYRRKGQEICVAILQHTQYMVECYPRTVHRRRDYWLGLMPTAPSLTGH